MKEDEGGKNKGKNKNEKPYNNAMDFSEFRQKFNNKPINRPASGNKNRNRPVYENNPKIIKKPQGPQGKKENVIDFKNFISKFK